MSIMIKKTQLFPIHELFKIEEKTSQPPSKRRKKVKPAAVNWRQKQNLKETPEENFTYLAKNHPQLALLEPIALFRLLLIALFELSVNSRE